MTEVERGRRRRPNVDCKGKKIGSAPCWDDDRRPAKVLKHVQVDSRAACVAGVGPGHFLPQRKIGTAAPCMLSSRARSVKLRPMFPPAYFKFPLKQAHVHNRH